MAHNHVFDQVNGNYAGEQLGNTFWYWKSNLVMI